MLSGWKIPFEVLLLSFGRQKLSPCMCIQSKNTKLQEISHTLYFLINLPDECFPKDLIETIFVSVNKHRQKL